ncbi:hypothetical protein Pelo_17275 [Pelomyxa schiedti]|nr:hypothetical protein Pelo_17275 [Pelomyxa schiedti]
MVVRPGWLDGDSSSKRKDEKNGCRNLDLFRVGEAMFPLVGVVCSRATALCRTRNASRYSVLTSAASVPAPRCVARLVNNFRSAAVVRGDRRAQKVPFTVPKGESGTAAVRGDGIGNLVVACDRWDSLCSVKEVVAALLGLCIGGHLRMAQAMLGSCGDGGDGRDVFTSPKLWDGLGFSVTGWGEATPDVRNRLRERVIEYVRAECGNANFLPRVCVSGHLEVVSWLVNNVIGIDCYKNEAPSLLWVYTSLRSCIRGKIEVFNWLFDKFNLAALGNSSVFHALYSCCAAGKFPGHIWWCVEKFPVSLDPDRVIGFLFPNKHSTAEDCQRLEAAIREGGVGFWNAVLQSIQKVDVAKWLLTVFPFHEPDEDVLDCLCQNTGDVEFVQWLCPNNGVLYISMFHISKESQQ